MQRSVTENDRTVAVSKQRVSELSIRHNALDSEAAQKEARYLPLTEKHNKALPDLLQKAEAKEDKERKTVSSMEALQMCHDRFTETAEEERCCPICARDMSESELSVMQKTMRQKLKEVPATIAAKKSLLDKTRVLVKEVRTLIPFHNDVVRIKEEIKAVEAQQSNAHDAYETNMEGLRSFTAKLDTLSKEITDFQALTYLSNRIKEQEASGRAVEESIRSEEVKIAAQYGEGVRPLDLVEKEIDEVQSKLNQVVGHQQETMAELERARNVSSLLAHQIQQQHRVVDQKQHSVTERDSVKQQYEALHAEYTTGNDTCADIKAQLQPREQKLASLEHELARRREEGDRREEDITKQVESRQESFSKVSGLVQDVKAHVASNSVQKAADMANRVTQLEEQQGMKIHEKECSEQKVFDLSAKLNNQEKTRRELEANLQYRTVCKEVIDGENNLQALRKTIQQRTHNHEGVWSSLDKLREQKSEEERKRATFQGQLLATEQLLNERQTELQSTKYDRIDERYNSTLIRLTTAQLADDDLAKYSQALDKSLIKYHDEKIGEVNEVIRDLWIRTYRYVSRLMNLSCGVLCFRFPLHFTSYRGNDIDHIELRSDIESAVARRSYNYRVVMVKNGVALDMRGRCSAGQKVLASLVVRIALSQAFCGECGILALDEPTTNLDLENIDSLAYALTELIEARKINQNFQLVVITHDEQFVRRIGRVCGTETVFHITKSVDGQYSTITEREFTDFT